jgi:DNA polymerase/3'-5' exonuclease PolX
MKFQELSDLFHDHAIKLSESNDKSAKYRSMNYEKTAVKLAEFDKSETVTKKKILSSDLSDYMKTIAITALETKKIKLSSRDLKKSTTKRSKSKDSTKRSSKTLVKELSEFMGLGSEKSKKLIEAGLKSANELHMKKYYDLLPEETKLFINLKPLQKIPHEHIKILEKYILDLGDSDISVKLVGSYRRKKPYSSDIDIMISSDKMDSLDIFIQKLRSDLNKYNIRK